MEWNVDVRREEEEQLKSVSQQTPVELEVAQHIFTKSEEKLKNK